MPGGIIRATTPTLTLIVGDSSLDLAQADNVYVALRQGDLVIELSGEELSIDRNTIYCYLSQEKSLQLQDGVSAKLQVNWTYTDDSGNTKRAATVVRLINIGEQLLTKVLT